MPRGDGTGPMGLGPMTGRAAGYCAGYPVPGFMNPGFGRGFARGMGLGFGRGFGRGYRAWNRIGWPSGYGYSPYPAAGVPYYGTAYVPQITSEQEIEALNAQSQYFKEALEDISKRIEELQAKVKQK